MKLNKKHIPMLAVVVQTAQYALAGYFLIGHLGWFFLGSMGALVSIAMAYATSQFSDMAQKRKGASVIALIAIMLFSPVLIGTAAFVHLTVINHPVWRGVVSAAWGFLPDGAVALAGFVAGKGLVDQGTKKKVARKAGNKTGKKKQVARKHVKDEDLLAYLASNPGASQQQVASHFGVTRQAIGPRVKKLYEVKNDQRL